jgi:hypothetical protein
MACPFVLFADNSSQAVQRELQYQARATVKEVKNLMRESAGRAHIHALEPLRTRGCVTALRVTGSAQESGVEQTGNPELPRTASKETLQRRSSIQKAPRKTTANRIAYDTELCQHLQINSRAVEPGSLKKGASFVQRHFGSESR